MYNQSNYDEKQKARQILNQALMMYYHVPVAIADEDEYAEPKPKVGISKRVRNIVTTVASLITK